MLKKNEKMDRLRMSNIKWSYIISKRQKPSCPPSYTEPSQLHIYGHKQKYMWGQYNILEDEQERLNITV